MPTHPSHLLDRRVAPHALVTVLLFATMFAALLVLPEVLPFAPYNFNEALLGVCNGVPFGVGGLLAAPLGGLLADKLSHRFGTEEVGSPAGRMVAGTAGALTIMPVAVLLFGWGFHYKLHPALPLLGAFLINFSMTLQMPATTSMISILKQKNAGAACGALHALQFFVAGAFVQATPAGVHSRLGVGGFMTLLVGIVVLAAAVAAAMIVRSLRAHEAPPPREEDEEEDFESVSGSEAGGGGGADLEAGAAKQAPGAAHEPPLSPSRGHHHRPLSRQSRRTSVDVALENIAGVQLA